MPSGDDSVQFDTNTYSSWNKNYGGNFSVNIDYQVDTMTDLSAWFNANFNGTKSWSGNGRSRLTDDGINPMTFYSFGDTTDSKNNGLFGMVGADITHKFDNQGHNLRAGVNGNYSHGWNDQWYNRDYTTYDDLDENKYNLTYTDSWSAGANARYNRPIDENTDLSLGARFDHSYMHNRYDKLLDLDGDQTYESTDTLRQYIFTGSDDNLNADLNLTRRWGGFTAELGLGGGYTHTGYKYENMYFPGRQQP